MKQLIVIFAILSLLTLQGCPGTTGAIKTDVVYVDKIVPVDAPQPPVTPRPTLEILKLTEAQKADEGLIAQTYKATIKQLQGYAEQLEAVIDGYRKKP